MKRYLDGLHLQLLGLIILPLSLLLLALAFAGVRIHQDAMRSLVAERDERSVRAAAAAISEQLHHREAAVRAIAQRVEDGVYPQIVLDQVGHLLEDYDGGLAIFDLAGNALASAGDAQSWLDVVPEGLIAGLENGDFRFSDDFLDTNMGAVILVMTRRGDRVAIGAFTVASLMRSATLGPTIGSENYRAFITDRSGRVLASVGADMPQEKMASHPGVQAALRGESGSIFTPAEDGEHVVAFSSILPTRWALIVEEPWEAVTSPVLNLSLIAPLSLVPVLIVMFIALWFGSRQIITPLRKLEQKASRLAEGDHEAVEESVGGITEIRHLQRTLAIMTQRIRNAQDALRGYISTMTRTQEDERRRLARELHDETIQDLIALGQQVQMIGMELRNAGLDDVQEIKQLHQATQEAIERVRRLSRGLRPIYLEDLGLIPALEMLARDTENEIGVPISFHSEGDVRRLDADTELALYRIVQEALSNAGRHANANHVWITVHFEEGAVGISIRDDGAGFRPPEQTSDLARYGHYGLIGMAERAVLIDAQMDIQSEPNKGTQIRIHLALDDGEETS